METEVVAESETAFTYYRGADLTVLKNPDGGVKKISERFLEDLLRVAVEEKTISEYPSDFGEQVAALRAENYIYDGEVVKLSRPEFSLLPYLAVFVVAFSPYVYVAGSVTDKLVAVLTSVSVHPPVLVFVYGPLVMLPTVAVHEYGHYREAGKHVPVSFGLGTINGLVPAFKTYTTETWVLSRAHRIWINLAGLTYQSLVLLPLVGMYHFGVSPPLPGFEPVVPWLLVGYIATSLCFVLNPLYHGDGYLIMTDALGTYNLRTRAKDEYRNGNVNLYSLYALLSYGLVNAYTLGNMLLTLVVWGLVIGPVLVAISLLFIYIEFSEGMAREFVAHEPDWVNEIHVTR